MALLDKISPKPYGKWLRVLCSQVGLTSTCVPESGVLNEYRPSRAGDLKLPWDRPSWVDSICWPTWIARVFVGTGDYECSAVERGNILGSEIPNRAQAHAHVRCEQQQ